MFQMEPSGGKNSAALHSVLIGCLGGSFVCIAVHALKLEFDAAIDGTLVQNARERVQCP